MYVGLLIGILPSRAQSVREVRAVYFLRETGVDPAATYSGQVLGIGPRRVLSATYIDCLRMGR